MIFDYPYIRPSTPWPRANTTMFIADATRPLENYGADRPATPPAKPVIPQPTGFDPEPRKPGRWKFWKKAPPTVADLLKKQLYVARIELIDQQEQLERDQRDVDHTIANMRMIQTRITRLEATITKETS